MLALTVRQPWAFLICSGAKRIENRTWRTEYRGPILIHSSKAWSQRELDVAMATFDRDEFPEPEAFHCGAIIGSAVLTDIVKDSADRAAIDGNFHWELDEAKLFVEPIPYRGSLSLWRPDADAIDAVRRAA